MDTYLYAVKLLAKRDYTIAELRGKLEAKFGPVPTELIDQLIRKNFLNDRRYAENFVAKHKNRGRERLRQELIDRGVAFSLAAEILSGAEWPSLQQALKARMNDWNLRAPFHRRDAARLFRALARLGYDEDAIREELDQLHDQ